MGDPFTWTDPFTHNGYWLRAQAAHDTEVAERTIAPTLKKIKPWSAYASQQIRMKTT